MPFGFFRMRAPATYVGSTSVQTANPTTSTSIQKPAALAVGDLMITFIGKDNTSAVTPPVGWIARQTTSISSYGCDLFTKVADAADVAAASFTFSFASAANATDRHSHIVHYRGVSATPVTTTAKSSGGVNTLTYPSTTTTSYNSTIVAIGGSYSMPSIPTGFTNRNNDGWATRVTSKVQAAPAATGTFTSTGSTGYITFVVIVEGR